MERSGIQRTPSIRELLPEAHGPVVQGLQLLLQLAVLVAVKWLRDALSEVPPIIIGNQSVWQSF
jgi:hypothetical protein